MTSATTRDGLVAWEVTLFVRLMTDPMSRLQFALRLGLLSGVPALLVGCGATGLDWVGEAHVNARPTHATVTSSSTSLSIPATVDPDSIAEARPRLNHTVTLGEIDVAAAERTAGDAPAAPPGVSVTVNNYNWAGYSTPAYGYPSYGYARFQPSFSPGNAARSSTAGPQPGQNWPAISDHGPSFPYGSAPASPWPRTR